MDNDARRITGELERLLETREEVRFAYLYGSMATDRTHRLSDVDVAVFVDPDALADRDRWAPWGYAAEMNAFLSEAADSPVNVVLLNEAPPLLSDRVARQGRLILSRDESRRRRWIVETKSRYCDLAVVRRRLRETLEERIASDRFGR